MTDGANFPELIEPVAKQLWGDPNPKMSGKSELRWGSGGSRSVDIAKGTWFNHEEHIGGGVIDLVMASIGCEKTAAIEWLESQGYIQQRPARSADDDDRRPPDLGPSGQRIAVAKYDYTDRDGNLLYQVVRYQWRLPDGRWEIDPKSGTPQKTFRQRRKDAAGETVWNLDGIGHTIYRHPLVEQAIADGKTLFVCEGEKDVETLEALGLAATTNSGGAQGWLPAHSELLRDADAVILVDNDEAGRRRGEAVARSLKGIARRIRVLDLAQHVPMPAKADISDWIAAGGTLDQLSEIIGQLPDWLPSPPVSKFGAVGLHELRSPSLQHDFLVEGFLDRQGVAMMPGASGSGKTFIVLELAMCIALGLPFFDMPTKTGLVLYQAGEGRQGVAKRLEGWMWDRGHAPSEHIPFRMLTRRINIFSNEKDAEELIEEGKAWSAFYGMPVRMVVIDTFNKAITGANEIAGQDMTKVIAQLEKISVSLDCAVVVPIHKSAEGRMRGHTSLTGDVANVINVTELEIRDRNHRTVRTVVLDKNKDGDRGSPLRFVLRQVVLDVDATGKLRTTCVVDRPGGDDEELVKQGRLSVDQTLVLRALKDAIDRDGVSPAPGIRGVPMAHHVVEWRAWREEVRRTWFFKSSEDEPAKREKELNDVMQRTAKALALGGYVARDSISVEGEAAQKHFVWWTGKVDRPRHDPLPTLTVSTKAVPF